MENDLKWSSQKTIMFQTGIIKACRNDVNINGGVGSDIEKRLELIEKKLANFNNMKPNIPYQESANVVPTNKIERKVETKVENSDVKSSNNLSATWKKIVDSLKRNGKIRLYTALINTRVNEVNDLIWEIEFPNGLTSFNQRILEDVNNNNELVKEIFKVVGKEVHLKYKDLKNINQKEMPNTKSNINNLGIDINIIE